MCQIQATYDSVILNCQFYCTSNMCKASQINLEKFSVEKIFHLLLYFTLSFSHLPSISLWHVQNLATFGMIYFADSDIKIIMPNKSKNESKITVPQDVTDFILSLNLWSTKPINCVPYILLWEDKGIVRGPGKHGLPIHNIVTVQCNSPFQLDPRAVLFDSKEQPGAASVSIPEELLGNSMWDSWGSRVKARAKWWTNIPISKQAV